MISATVGADWHRLPADRTICPISASDVSAGLVRDFGVGLAFVEWLSPLRFVHLGRSSRVVYVLENPIHIETAKPQHIPFRQVTSDMIRRRKRESDPPPQCLPLSVVGFCLWGSTRTSRYGLRLCENRSESTPLTLLDLDDICQGIAQKAWGMETLVSERLLRRIGLAPIGYKSCYG